MDEQLVEADRDRSRSSQAKAEHPEGATCASNSEAANAAEGSLGPAAGTTRQEERGEAEERGDRGSHGRLGELEPRRDLRQRDRGRERDDSE